MRNDDIFKLQVEALNIMRRRDFQSSSIVMILDDEDAIRYLLKRPDTDEYTLLNIAGADGE